jgi:2-iminoacetate synthase ThiH
MSKFYVKLWMPALEMHVLFVERDSWDEIVAVYRGLADAGFDAVIGRNSGLFDDEEERG